MINSVGALLLFVVALTSCCARGYELDDDDFGTPNRTLAPILPKAAEFQRLQDNPSSITSEEIKALTSTCRCGIVRRTVRIVGGTTTQVNEYPWQVGLISPASRFVFCGGSLISDRFVLTAAHCTEGLTTSSFRLLLGGHTQAWPIATEKIVYPISIIQHPQYTVGAPNNNDISLIKITPLVFSTPGLVIRPICLPNSGDLYAGVMATTTGWGMLYLGGPTPNILMEVNIPVVTNAVCTSVYGPAEITNNMICAGTAGKDSCKGDSGGPLIAPDGANYELIGVVSFGAGCRGLPGVYTRVSTLQSWIVSQAAGSYTCGR